MACPMDRISNFYQVHRLFLGLTVAVVFRLSSGSLILFGYSICWSFLNCTFLWWRWPVALANPLLVFHCILCYIGAVFDGGSSIEYALASTVPPTSRRGVISFLLHRQFYLSLVGRNYPSFILVGCDAWVVDRWQS